MKISNKYKGFTLIELLVTVAVIAVLSGLVISALNVSGIQAKTRDGNRGGDLKKIQEALELSYARNREYPNSGVGSWINLSTGGNIVATALVPLHLKELPVDPKGPDTTESTPCSDPDSYRYNYIAINGSRYVLTAIMEIGSSHEGHECTALNNWSAVACGAGFATENFCYGVENPL